MINIIEIGRHAEGAVALNMKESGNFHIVITGRSGSGKSVADKKSLEILQSVGRSQASFLIRTIYSVVIIFCLNIEMTSRL